ncbi:MAG: precorrin-3B synthase [Methyloceanibacter sp.]|uniref:precorrin-3B synthase n=1 Tax=Methyloceanibacter sp. TaxID=1965321 RepID=UPI003D9B0BAB
MSAISVRGACPGLSTPMLTGDGLLVRLMPTPPISLDAFAGFCAAALAQGNGTIEVTARGGLQVRGLTPVSALSFASAVGELDLPASEGVSVVTDALPGDPRALIDAASLAAELRAAIEAARLALAPKLSIVVDGGGPLHLDALKADIRLLAVDAERLLMALAGDAASATPLGIVSRDDACPAVLHVLRRIAVHGPTSRAADILRDQGIAASRVTLAAPLKPATALQPRPRAQMLGRHPLTDGSLVLGIGLAFGHAQASELIGVISAARYHGATWLRPAPDRALLLGPLNEAGADAVAGAAEGFSFIVSASDPRRRVVACPGAPFCASGHIPARALAAELAPFLPPGQGIALHISGCAKGCAHPKMAPLTIVGSESGFGVVRNGTARAPSAFVDTRGLHAALLQDEDVEALEPADA